MLPSSGLVLSWRVDVKTSYDQPHPRDRYPALVSGIFVLLIGFISMRRSSIYFSILTLAFEQMSFAFASSVLTPITGRETDLQTAINDRRVLDTVNESRNIPAQSLFGLHMNHSYQIAVGNWLWQFSAGYYVAVIFMIIAFKRRFAFKDHPSG